MNTEKLEALTTIMQFNKMADDEECTCEVRELKSYRYHEVISDDKIYDLFELNCEITPDQHATYMLSR